MHPAGATDTRNLPRIDRRVAPAPGSNPIPAGPICSWHRHPFPPTVKQIFFRAQPYLADSVEHRDSSPVATYQKSGLSPVIRHIPMPLSLASTLDRRADRAGRVPARGGGLQPAGDHLGIDRIGLGPSSNPAGQRPDLRRVEDIDPEPGLGQVTGERLLVAAGGLERERRLPCWRKRRARARMLVSLWARVRAWPSGWRWTSSRSLATPMPAKLGACAMLSLPGWCCGRLRPGQLFGVFGNYGRDDPRSPSVFFNLGLFRSVTPSTSLPLTFRKHLKSITTNIQGLGRPA